MSLPERIGARLCRWVISFPELAYFDGDEQRHVALRRAYREVILLGAFVLGLFLLYCLFSWYASWTRYSGGGGLPVEVHKWLEEPMPSWFGPTFWGLLLTTLWVSRRVARHRIRKQLVAEGVPVCMRCGHDLRGHLDSRCPRCAAEFDPSMLPRDPGCEAEDKR